MGELLQENSIKFLNNLINYEKINKYSYTKSFSLERVRLLFDNIGNPEKKLKAIHIAGTKGKGSTVWFIASILAESGYKVGVYTSPHITLLNERICILNPSKRFISNSSLSSIVFKIIPAIKKIGKVKGVGYPTFFEVLTAIAFLYFTKERVDFAVLETGLGGRLDATNVVLPLVSVITPISFEHTNILGNTLDKIAKEKAGIIKHNIPCISAPQRKKALEVIKNRCKNLKSNLFILEKNMKILSVRLNNKRTYFNLYGLTDVYTNLKLNMIGNKQVDNASLAIGSVELLKLYYKVNIPKKAVYKGLSAVSLKGRLEIISVKPTIMLDGGHCIASMEALKNTLKLFNYNRLILIFGIADDKDIDGIGRIIGNISDYTIFTCFSSPRAIEPLTLANKMKMYIRHSFVSNSPISAMKLALKLANSNDFICVTGSFYLVGELIKRERMFFCK